MKTCTVCKEDKPNTSEFFSLRPRKDGTKATLAICKGCCVIKQRAWRLANPEKYKESGAKWRESHKDYTAAYNRERSKDANYRARRAVTHREWKRLNPEKAREIYLRYQYKMNPNDLMCMMDAQRGCCDICGESLVVPESPISYAVDHSHSTGKVRGLLCHNCNHLVGNCKENEEILLKAIDYIKKHKEIND